MVRESVSEMCLALELHASNVYARLRQCAAERYLSDLPASPGGVEAKVDDLEVSPGGLSGVELSRETRRVSIVGNKCVVQLEDDPRPAQVTYAMLLGVACQRMVTAFNIARGRFGLHFLRQIPKDSSVHVALKMHFFRLLWDCASIQSIEVHYKGDTVVLSAEQNKLVSEEHRRFTIVNETGQLQTIDLPTDTLHPPPGASRLRPPLDQP